MVGNWELTDRNIREAAAIVLAHVSEESRKYLPESLASIRTVNDAVAWLKQQQVEKTAVLLADQKPSWATVAVLIASEQFNSEGTKLYIGYLVLPSCQGNGFATELVQGFIKWTVGLTKVSSIVAGVDSSNAASVSVLKKSGFVPMESESSAANYVMYEHRLDI